MEMGEKILAIHTGGLQGVTGINQKLKKKNYKQSYIQRIFYSNDFSILISAALQEN